MSVAISAAPSCSQTVAMGFFGAALIGIPSTVAFTHYTTPYQRGQDAEGILMKNLFVGIPLFASAGLLGAPFFQINQEVKNCLEAENCQFSCTKAAVVIAATTALLAYIKWRTTKEN